MSVLSFPRIVLNGTTAWNPATQNNQLGFGYAKNPVKVQLPTGVTYDSYDDWLIAQDNSGKTNGDWNVFGQHHALFDATVANTLTGPGTSPGGDPLLGGTLRLTGGVPKLVDVNPYSPVTSQIFLKTVGIESNGGGFSGPAAHRMTSRRPFFQRNIASPKMQIAGGMGVVWQTVIAKSDISWTSGQAASPTLTALQAAMDQGSVLGLMLRVTSYTTIYFKDIVPGGWLQQSVPEVYGALAKKWAAIGPVNPGNIASTFNPAISSLVGAVGLWEEGDLMTVPNGRVMAGMQSDGSLPALGSGEAKVNAAAGCISLDLMNAVPETDATNTKAELGDLDLVAKMPDGSSQTVGSISSTDTAKAAYESGGGIVDVKCTVDPATLTDATLALEVANGGIPVLAEMDLTAEVDSRSVYVDLGASGSFEVQVGAGDRPLPSGLTLHAAIVSLFDSAAVVKLTGGSGSDSLMSYDVGADGKVTVTFDAVAKGNCVIEVTAAPAGQTPSFDTKALPAPTQGYAAVRVMPTDDDIANVPDAQVTWDYVYDNVLRPFDLVYRGMSCGVFSLGDEGSVRANANAIAGLTDPAMFDSPLYMPVTRDLSSGRRALLMRFLGLSDGGAPIA